MSCSHVHSRQWPRSVPVLLTGYKTKRTSTLTPTFSFATTGHVRSTDEYCFALQAAILVRRTDKWRQRPIRFTDGENSSGLCIAFSILPCPICLLATER
eukprot:2849327-Amphidinium_carterae.1